ncbi:histidine phosphatase family protein [Cetobacterium ceti]
MGKLILIRHGETDLNKAGVYFGKLDPELNCVGKFQGEKTRDVLENLKINYDNIYTSDLKRASETAQLVNYKNLEINYSSKLQELHFGIFEGYSYEQLKKIYPKELEFAEKNWENYNYKTGESVKELQERAVNFVEQELDLKKDNIIVTHWGVINTLLSYFFSKNLESYWKYSVNNGGIVIIEFLEDFPILKGLNIGG